MQWSSMSSFLLTSCSMDITARPDSRSWAMVAWVPADLAPLTKTFGREVRSGVARLGKNLSGRALYNDGQMTNSNVINHVTKERLGWIRFQQTTYYVALIGCRSIELSIFFWVRLKHAPYLQPNGAVSDSYSEQEYWVWQRQARAMVDLRYVLISFKAEKLWEK